MRRHVFTLLPPVGDQETVEEGSVIDLLGRIPYLLSWHILPPLHVLNELLQIGHSDAGMSGGCRWNPFTLSQEEFRELVSVLAQREGEDFVEFVSPPKWVTSLKKTNAISGLERHQYMEIYNISCSKTISPYISQSLFCVEGHIRPVLHLIDPHKLKTAF